MTLLSLSGKFFESSKTGLEVTNCGNRNRENPSIAQHSLHGKLKLFVLPLFKEKYRHS
jgi:hypothetical protein